MNRRRFLQSLPPLLAFGSLLSIDAEATLNGPFPEIDLSVESLIELPDCLGCGYNTTAASFHSELWGSAGNLHFYRNLWLPDFQKEFPEKALLSIEGRRLVNDNFQPPDIAIALANPEDQLSWDAAIKQCQLAKSSGALTLLLAAYPEREDGVFDDRDFERDHKSDSKLGPETIIRVVTWNAYAEMANVVFEFTHIHDILHNTDLADFRRILQDAGEAILLNGCSHGPDRALLATHEAMNLFLKYPDLKKRIKGAVVFMYIDVRSYKLEEYVSVIEVLEKVLPEDALSMVSLVGRRRLDPFVNISAIITLDA